jgi:sarcosine oxidase, subunit beta
VTPSRPGRSRRRVYDVAVIGGGIVGCSAAVFLARAGLSVVLLERAEIAAGASGRNSGAIQRPFDTALAELYHETLTIYRTLAGEGPDFQLASEPAGLLLLSDDADALAHTAAAIAAEAPDLQPERLDAEALAHAEPGLAPGLAACRLQTGFPVAPAAATLR